MIKGENVFPERIENELDKYQIINSSLVFKSKTSSGREIISVKVFPNYDYAKTNQIANITDIIQDIVDEINKKFPKYMNINDLIILKKDFIKSGSMKIIREKNIS